MPEGAIYPDWERLEEALTGDENVGFCIACGEEADCVEPDARGYTCESCGRPSVYGAQEILFMTDGGI